MTAVFTHHTVETAPEQARPTLENTTKGFGFLPAPVALMSESPQVLDAFLSSNALFNKCSFSQLEREVVIMTIATRVQCHYCVAMHSAMLTKSGADQDLLAALRDARSLPDPRLEALRVFTLKAMETFGAVADPDLRAFLDAGFTPRSALDVVLGLGVYTLSTYANRMTDAQVDGTFKPFEWHPH